MGYCYERTYGGGRGRLVCDRCGHAGGVRKRTCPHKVRGSGFKTPGAERYELPYCPPPALCGPCLKAEGGTKALHARCAEPAARMSREAEEERQRLDAGELRVASAFGSWHESVPDGQVGVHFAGLDGTEVAVLIPDADYAPGAKPWLSDYETIETWEGAR